MGRLDTRKCLYGEPRLTDQQVILLRCLAFGGVTRTRPSQNTYYSQDGSRAFNARQIEGLERLHLLHRSEDEKMCVATPRGDSVLAAIDAASAPSPARSAP